MCRWSLACACLCACYDPAGASSSTAEDATGSSSGSSATLATDEASATLTSTSASTSTSATSSPSTTDAPTTDVDTTAGEVDSESDTTGVPNGCLDGAFVEDAPPLQPATLAILNYNLQGVEIVDVDGDGTNDLLLGDFGDADPSVGGVYFARGQGTGIFDDPIQLPGAAPTVRISAAAIADATLDVVGVVAVPPEYNIAVRRWRGNGNGTFLAPIDYPMASDWDVDLFDVDGDGRRDLLGTGAGGALVALANAAEGFGAVVAHGGVTTLNAIRGADLDGDGDGDIVAAADTSIIVLLGAGDGTFAPPVSYPMSTPGQIDVLIADFDGNGALDIGSTWDAIVAVLPGDGLGGFGAVTELTVQGSTLSADTPDFDGDGCADIVVFNNTGSVSTIMSRDGFTFTAQEVFNISANGYPYDIAAGDLNGDAIPDVVAVTAGGGADGGEAYVLLSG